MQSGIAFFVTLASTFYLPQSPRWLAHKGRKEEASLAWDKLGVSGAEREKNLLQDPAPTTDVTISARGAETEPLSLRDKIRENIKDVTAVFRGEARKPMLLGVFLMSVQQLSGIDGIIYVSTRSHPGNLYSGHSSSIMTFPNHCAVRAVTLSASWPRLIRGQILSLWHLRYLYFHFHHNSSHLRGPLGPSAIHNLWRAGTLCMHGGNGFVVRNRQCPRLNGHWSMGCYPHDLYLFHRILDE